MITLLIVTGVLNFWLVVKITQLLSKLERLKFEPLTYIPKGDQNE